MCIVLGALPPPTEVRGFRRIHSMKPLEELPLAAAFEASSVMMQAFLEQVLLQGSPQQQQLARGLQHALQGLALQDPAQSVRVTPREFEAVAAQIREEMDPLFRLSIHLDF